MDLHAWEKEHGTDPANWPLPKGQPLTWRQWAEALSAEAVRRGWNPDFWPMREALISGGCCWCEDWLEGKSPLQTAQAYHERMIKPRPASL